MIDERKAVGVLFDAHRGHVTINGATGPALVTMVDTGKRLELWSYEGAHLSPSVARELASALNSWADTRSPEACRYPCGCGQFPENHCSCMDGHNGDA